MSEQYVELSTPTYTVVMPAKAYQEALIKFGGKLPKNPATLAFALQKYEGQIQFKDSRGSAEDMEGEYDLFPSAPTENAEIAQIPILFDVDIKRTDEGFEVSGVPLSEIIKAQQVSSEPAIYTVVSAKNLVRPVHGKWSEEEIIPRPMPRPTSANISSSQSRRTTTIEIASGMHKIVRQFPGEIDTYEIIPYLAPRGISSAQAAHKINNETSRYTYSPLAAKHERNILVSSKSVDFSHELNFQVKTAAQRQLWSNPYLLQARAWSVPTWKDFNVSHPSQLIGISPGEYFASKAATQKSVAKQVTYGTAAGLADTAEFFINPIYSIGSMAFGALQLARNANARSMFVKQIKSPSGAARLVTSLVVPVLGFRALSSLVRVTKVGEYYGYKGKLVLKSGEELPFKASIIKLPEGKTITSVSVMGKNERLSINKMLIDKAKNTKLGTTEYLKNVFRRLEITERGKTTVTQHGILGEIEEIRFTGEEKFIFKYKKSPTLVEEHYPVVRATGFAYSPHKRILIEELGIYEPTGLIKPIQIVKDQKVEVGIKETGFFVLSKDSTSGTRQIAVFEKTPFGRFATMIKEEPIKPSKLDKLLGMNETLYRRRIILAKDDVVYDLNSSSKFFSAKAEKITSAQAIQAGAEDSVKMNSNVTKQLTSQVIKQTLNTVSEEPMQKAYFELKTLSSSPLKEMSVPVGAALIVSSSELKPSFKQEENAVSKGTTVKFASLASAQSLKFVQSNVSAEKITNTQVEATKLENAIKPVQRTKQENVQMPKTKVVFDTSAKQVMFQEQKIKLDIRHDSAAISLQRFKFDIPIKMKDGFSLKARIFDVPRDKDITRMKFSPRINETTKPAEKTAVVAAVKTELATEIPPLPSEPTKPKFRSPIPLSIGANALQRKSKYKNVKKYIEFNWFTISSLDKTLSQAGKVDFSDIKKAFKVEI